MLEGIYTSSNYYMMYYISIYSYGMIYTYYSAVFRRVVWRPQQFHISIVNANKIENIC